MNIFATQNLKMNKFFFVFFVLLTQLNFAQTQEEILKEADNRNISTKQQVLNELAQNGISEQAAREMAVMRGIDFDTFLNEYFSNNKSAKSTSSKLDQSENTVDKISIKNDFKLQDVDSVTTSNITFKNENKFFGYSIFETNPFKNKEYLIGNIDEGYILAPGDELKIMVFGNNSLEAVLKIDLNGNISIPNLGVFQAAGNTFKTLKTRLKLFLGKFYIGLLSYPQETFLDISLTQIRPVNVTVLGEVNSPGSHLVNGLATTLNALYAAGGVKTSGTLREIKIFRNNKLISTVDLYDYITGNRLNSDVRLSNNDIIFVGSRISSIELIGEVKNQSIFEIKKDETLDNLIYFSGGLPSTASTYNVNISRINSIDKRFDNEKFDRFLTTVDLSKNTAEKFKLQDGDVVEFRKILDEQLNEVTINGNVNIEGKFSILKFSNLKDLIINGANGLKENTYFKKLDIIRTDESGKKYFKSYSLADILSENIKVNLEDRDEIKIYNLEDVRGKSEITITGFVSSPKTTFWKEGMTLFDLIFESTSFEELNFQKRVLKSRVDLKRFDEKTGLYETLVFSLTDLNELNQITLIPNDNIVLYTRNVFEVVDKKVYVLGSVKNSNVFDLEKEMYVEDAILNADGFNEDALKSSVMVYSYDRNIENGTYSNVSKYEVDMDYMLGKVSKPSNPFILNHNDVVSVSSVIRAFNLQVVEIEGEINNPSPIVLNKDSLSFEEALSRTGGLTNLAELKSSYIIRDEKILFYDLTKASNKKSLNLISGDRIVIASKLKPIKTEGAFLNPSSFSDEQKRAKYYIRLSGKKMNRVESTLVVRNNGSSKKVNMFSNPKVYPGDTIVANSKPEKDENDNSQKFFDNFTRIFSLITGALTTLYITSKL